MTTPAPTGLLPLAEAPAVLQALVVHLNLASNLLAPWADGAQERSTLNSTFVATAAISLKKAGDLAGTLKGDTNPSLPKPIRDICTRIRARAVPAYVAATTFTTLLPEDVGPDLLRELDAAIAWTLAEAHYDLQDLGGELEKALELLEGEEAPE